MTMTQVKASFVHSFVAKLLAVVIVISAVLTSWAPTAMAHAGDQSYLYLDLGESLTARLQMPLADIDEFLGIEIDGTDEQIDAGIQANVAALRAFAEEHFDIGLDGEIFDRRFVAARLFADTTHVELEYAIETGPEVPERFDVRLDPFFDEEQERDALLLVANDWDRGIVDNEAEHLLRFTPDSRSQEVSFGDASSWNNFTASVATGLNHIREGPDHMLFIFALMLPSVLVWSTSWKPVSGFLSSLWRVTKIMTMFTLAHSVTFTLAGIGAVPTPSSRVTETIIALSIAATALHNLRPIFRDREWSIAFVFGLFHGFGFASLVQSLDVSTKTQLVSLVGRNVGIELGQLLVVLLVFPSLYLLRVTRAYLPLFRVACVALIIVSIGWMLERMFDAPDWTSRVFDQLLAFPRVLVLVALVAVGSALWHLRERSADRLLDAHVTSSG